MGMLIAAGQPDEFPTGGADRAGRLYANFADILPYIVLGVLAIVAGAAVVWWVRRRLKEQVPTGPISQGATLTTFREMRDRCELTEKEYQTIRRNLVERMRQDMDV